MQNFILAIFMALVYNFFSWLSDIFGTNLIIGLVVFISIFIVFKVLGNIEDGIKKADIIQEKRNTEKIEDIVNIPLIKNLFIKKRCKSEKCYSSLSDNEKYTIESLLKRDYYDFVILRQNYSTLLNEYAEEKYNIKKIEELRTELYHEIVDLLSNNYKTIALEMFYYTEKLLNDEVEKAYKLEQKMIQIIRTHIKTLYKKRQMYLKVDDYGIVDDIKWEQEVFYFAKNVLQVYKIEKTYMREAIYDFVNNEIDLYEEEIKEAKIEYNDNMNGHEYEYFCSNILEKNGWDSKVTQGSGDQGVDIIAEKNDIKVAIQCKKHQKPVGNKAVQEIYTGKNHYEAEYAVVVASNGFTNSAKELAKTTNTILIHHNDLVDLDSFL